MLGGQVFTSAQDFLNKGGPQMLGMPTSTPGPVGPPQAPTQYTPFAGGNPGMIMGDSTEGFVPGTNQFIPYGTGPSPGNPTGAPPPTGGPQYGMPWGVGAAQVPNSMGLLQMLMRFL
jgi:hypothetical protein